MCKNFLQFVLAERLLLSWSFYMCLLTTVTVFHSSIVRISNLNVKFFFFYSVVKWLIEQPLRQSHNNDYDYQVMICFGTKVCVCWRSVVLNAESMAVLNVEWYKFQYILIKSTFCLSSLVFMLYNMFFLKYAPVFTFLHMYFLQ